MLDARMERRRFEVTGVVQGVGFRPFVAGLAHALGLGGLVRNDSHGVVIEVEGPPDAVDAFGDRLVREAPPLARIDAVEASALPPGGEAAFHIDASGHGEGRRSSVPPDVAMCAACRHELDDPADRRHAYPFINCTQCGPRFTVIEALPYDRPFTTMRRFAMCADCRREYEDQDDRRYHAEPTACPVCGPHVWLEAPGDPAPRSARGAAIAEAQARLDGGEILAVKGIGGVHLACDAANDAAVAQLRARKGRGDKPFALMVPDVATVRGLCVVSAEEQREIESPAHPIVLLARRDDAGSRVSAHVAPGHDRLGVMLPYSPLHHLLLDGRTLVMTSGNRSDEPIAHTNEGVRETLADLADAFLLHDRDIANVCDDSVVMVVEGAPLPVRRSRGYAPLPVRLPFEVPPILAVGGELKTTFCLAQGRDAYLSQHLGDMETVETLDRFEASVERLLSLFAIAPEIVAIDPHPGYLTSSWARTWAAGRGCRVVPVQHHHAHLGAVLAERGRPLDDAVIGVVFDGTGYGVDGTVWGGEVFTGGYAAATRAGWLAPVPLPAGDVDVRHGGRLALAHLAAAGIAWDDDLPPVAAIPVGDRRLLAQRFARGLGMATSSSMGRLFDAVAALVGVRQASSYEAQAAIELEVAARRADPRVVAARRYPDALVERDAAFRVDPGPWLRAIVEDLRAGVTREILAARFHVAVVDAVAQLSIRVRETTGLSTVALSGGVFQNAYLLSAVLDRLEGAGFTVLTHRLVPPNDGGLALGQAVCAAAMAQTDA